MKLGLDMASPPAGPKTSRWGSFLTGLESKLDTILADEDVNSKNKTDGNALVSSDSKGTPAISTVQKARADSMGFTKGLLNWHTVNKTQVQLVMLLAAERKTGSMNV